MTLREIIISKISESFILQLLYHIVLTSKHICFYCLEYTENSHVNKLQFWDTIKPFISGSLIVFSLEAQRSTILEKYIWQYNSMLSFHIEIMHFGN